MTTPNALYLANSAQQMARNAPAKDAVIFNNVAMICMGVMAAAAVVQTLHPLLHDLTQKHAKQTGRNDRGR